MTQGYLEAMQYLSRLATKHYKSCKKKPHTSGFQPIITSLTTSQKRASEAEAPRGALKLNEMVCTVCKYLEQARGNGAGQYLHSGRLERIGSQYYLQPRLAWTSHIILGQACSFEEWLTSAQPA